MKTLENIQDLKKLLLITQYTCYYNAIKRWESNHKETEILYQLEISNLLEQLKNN